jgi:hypothetical protein
VLQEVTSADGKYTVTVFERSCGATSPFARIVSVRAAGTKFNADDDSVGVLVVEDRPDIRLTSTEPGHLTIKLSGGGRVFRKAVVWSGVAISYE